VGVANGEGLYLDQRQVTAGDCMKFEAGERVLINRWVQAAVFESNARTILTQGLAYDRCTVGIVTDMRGGDLSDLYIKDQQALANVVRSQVDVILPEGMAVLNAADPEVVPLAELCDGAVMYYAVDENNEVLARHRANGGRVAFIREGRITLAHGADEIHLLDLAKIKPATAKHPESLLAAAGAAWALEVPADLICAGLRTFDATPKKTVNK
jgi:cyanophycin synthetase